MMEKFRESVHNRVNYSFIYVLQKHKTRKKTPVWMKEGIKKPMVQLWAPVFIPAVFSSLLDRIRVNTISWMPRMFVSTKERDYVLYKRKKKQMVKITLEKAYQTALSRNA